MSRGSKVIGLLVEQTLTGGDPQVSGCGRQTAMP